MTPTAVKPQGIVPTAGIASNAGTPTTAEKLTIAAPPPPLSASCFLLGTPYQQNSLLSSVVDQDTVGSGNFWRIRIRIRNKSFRILIRPIRIRNEFDTGT